MNLVYGFEIVTFVDKGSLNRKSLVKCKAYFFVCFFQFSISILHAASSTFILSWNWSNFEFFYEWQDRMFILNGEYGVFAGFYMHVRGIVKILRLRVQFFTYLPKFFSPRKKKIQIPCINVIFLKNRGYNYTHANDTPACKMKTHSCQWNILLLSLFLYKVNIRIEYFCNSAL